MPSVSEDQYRAGIARFCHLIYEKGYVASTDGNVSARLPDGHIMCTPTISNKGFVKPEDMVIIDMKAQKIKGERKASSEIAMHLLIYEMRPDIQAVVHAHPPCATAYAAAGIPLNKALISEVVLALGCIPLAEYGTPGTPELSDQLRPFEEFRRAADGQPRSCNVWRQPRGCFQPDGYGRTFRENFHLYEDSRARAIAVV